MARNGRRAAKANRMTQLHVYLAEKLGEIEDGLSDFGLGAMTRFTLIARDPANDRMSVCLTNEPDEDLTQAFAVATKARKRPQPTIDALLAAASD